MNLFFKKHNHTHDQKLASLSYLALFYFFMYILETYFSNHS